MFGFFSEIKTAPSRKPAAKSSKEMPLELMGKMGCSACPLNADKDLRNPKMSASGADSPDVYVLFSEATDADDREGEFGSSDVGAELLSQLTGRVTRRARWSAVTQCSTAQSHLAVARAQACCRSRVEQDIAASKPALVVAVGEAAFQWATGVSAVHAWRGSLIPSSFAGHAVWVVPVESPTYVYEKKRKGKSQDEMALSHDSAFIRDLLENADVLEPPEIVDTKTVFDGIDLLVPNHLNPAASLAELEGALHSYLHEPFVGLDIESNGLRPWRGGAQILTASIGTPTRALAFPLDFPNTWPTERWQKRAHGAFANFIMESGRKVCHNLAMEHAWLSREYGKILLRGTEWEDTMAAAHTLDERPGTKSLGAQTRLHFGFNLKDQSALDVKRLISYPVAQVLRYNAGDSKWTAALHKAQQPLIRSNPKFLAEYERKLRLIPTLVATEHRGVPVDLEYAEAINTKLDQSVKDIRSKISKLPEVRLYESKLRRTFDPGNNDQVLSLMQSVLNRPEVSVKDKNGGVRNTTDESALSSMPADEVPSAHMILELRGIEKLKSTYILPLLNGDNIGEGGVIRSQYGCMVAVTGRLNSEDPNIQNFPKRKHKEVRGVVRAEPDHILMPCDYGQIEFRVAGMCSEDEALIKACWTGYDVHMHWAQRLVEIYPKVKDWIVSEFGVDWDAKGMKTLRQESKNKWVFPCIFGASVRSRAESLHLPPDKATILDNEFWDEFRGVKKWQERLVKFYEKNLYVETLGGRRRRGAMSYNEIVNTPIQGTAADIVTAAMDALSEQADILEWPEIDPRINVHDDLTFMPTIAGQAAAQKHIVTEMCRHRFAWINVPLIVEVSAGDRWHECKEIQVARSNEIFNLRNPYENSSSAQRDVRGRGNRAAAH